MSMFVIAGSCACPYYAKLELLADQLASNLPYFRVHKIVISENKWEEWLQETCTNNGWEHKKSPIIWRELVERGGKGKLLGGFNDFMEYAQCYYGVTSDMMTDLMLKIKDENIIDNTNKLEEEEKRRSLIRPIHICIANASSPTAYHFIPYLASGEIFGKNVDISIELLDSDEEIPPLEGVAMETIDLAYPLVRNITVSSDSSKAFKDATAVIFLEDEEQNEDETREDFLLRLGKKYQNYAETLNSAALKDAKIIVGGSGLVNFSTFVLTEHAGKLSRENIVACPRLQERRARAILSRKLKVNSAGVTNVILWGNCSNKAPLNTMYIGTSLARVYGYDGAICGPEWFSRPLVEVLHDNKWITTEFFSHHHDHYESLENSLKHPSSVSEAVSLSSMMQDWIKGSSKEIFSLGVRSENWYAITDCIFSLPVRFSNGSYQVVDDLTLDGDAVEQLKKITHQLKKDLHVVYPHIGEDEAEVFGTGASLISSSLTESQNRLSTPNDKLEVIAEESESQSTDEAKNVEKMTAEVDEKTEDEVTAPIVAS